MNAIVRTGLAAGQMSYQEMPKPDITSGEALVRVKAVGVCGSDIHIYAGHMETEVPLIIGHEFSGVVEKIGKDDGRLKPGDRVVSRLNLGVCGVCRACLTGNPQMCEHRTCPGFKLDGAYAEYIAIDTDMLIKIPDTVSFEEAALTEPMAIVAHGLLERTRVEPEDTVVIFGPGPIGLIALQMAKMNGAARVIVVGTRSDKDLRLQLAEKMGADMILNSQEVDVAQVICELTDGQGADLVVEASGADGAINAGMQALRRQGRMCVLGLPGKRQSQVEWLTAAEKSLSVIFSYSSSPWSWNLVVSMMGRGAIDSKSLISHMVPLAQFEEVFDEISKGNVIKAVLLP